MSGKKERQIVSQEQAQLRKNIEEYLSEDPCVGVEAKELPQNPTAEKLCEIYRKAISLLNKSQNERDEETSIHATALVSDIFIGFWSCISTLKYTSDRYRMNNQTIVKDFSNSFILDSKVTESLITDYDTQNDIGSKEINETASMLCSAFLRALAELEHSVIENDISIIMHHLALVSDIIHEMLNLVMDLNPDRFTEENLPESHPHSNIEGKLQSEE